MPSKSKYKSKASTIETVRRFFVNTSDDSISLEDAFRTWGRDLEKVKDNKAWLSNKLTHLKYHNLIIPVYTYRNGRRVLEKLQLTLEGKRALGRIGENVDSTNEVSSTTNGNASAIDFKNVMKAVAKLREENPDYDITFDVKLRMKNG